MHLIRTYSAGIHVGTMSAAEGTVVTLTNARRIWRWRGANTLHEVSLRGVDEKYSRISEPVPEITLTEAIEIIPVADAAVDNLTRSRWPE
jgi:hypothetical protein